MQMFRRRSSPPTIGTKNTLARSGGPNVQAERSYYRRVRDLLRRGQPEDPGDHWIADDEDLAGAVQRPQPPTQRFYKVVKSSASRHNIIAAEIVGASLRAPVGRVSRLRLRGSMLPETSFKARE